MITIETFEEIEKDICIWIVKESKFSFNNIKDFSKMISEIDIKMILNEKDKNSGKFLIEEYIEQTSSCSNFISRILDLELYLYIKYGLKRIREFKNRIKNSLYLFWKFYPDDFLTRKQMKKLLKKYDFIIMMIAIQILSDKYGKDNIKKMKG